MSTRHRSMPALGGTIALALALAACGSGGGPEPADGPSPGPDADRRAELEEIYRARMESARQSVNPADVDFMTGMIAHHAQALVMAALAPTHEASPQMRILTARIINAQNDEIATMQGWLRDRGQPVPEIEIRGTTLLIDGHEHTMHMPGMLTQEQMRELDAGRGREFDRLFLKYMIQHHQGAVSMVHDLFATDGAGQDDLAFKLASDIQVDQRTEIARMKLMLESLPTPDVRP